MIAKSIDDLYAAMSGLSRPDLDAMTIEELADLEVDLGTWANLATITLMTKRAMQRDEEPE